MRKAELYQILQKASREAGLTANQEAIVLTAVSKAYRDKQAARIAKREAIITAALKAGQIQ